MIDFSVDQEATSPSTDTHDRDHRAAQTEARAERAKAIDRHIGGRMRARRLALGLSQQQVAEAIGVTYQQAHKYEYGVNRISACRLLEIAEVFAVPVSWFFDGLDTAIQQDESPRQRMCLELARNFAAIDNEKHQDALSQMARTLAEQSQARKS